MDEITNRGSLKNSLEIVTNIAVLLVALVVLGSVFSRFWARPEKMREGLRKGDIVTPLQGYSYQSPSQTLLLALNTNCIYCAASTPFFQRLSQIERDNPALVHVVAVFAEAKDAVDVYEKKNKLDVHTISGANFSALHVSGTPTLILVDNQGKVRDFWIGKLSDQAESSVIRAITNSTG